MNKDFLKKEISFKNLDWKNINFKNIELKNKKEVSDEMLEIIRLITETLREMKGELNE